MPNQTPATTTLINTDRKWQARWIWPQHADDGSNRVALFRHTVRVEHAQTCSMLITACSQYRLWADGTLIADGPTPSASHHTYYDTHSLELTAGEHTFAILVRTSRLPARHHGGLLVEILSADGSVIDASDATWRGVAGTAWRDDTFYFAMNKLSPYQEHLDARALPRSDGHEWYEPGFNDEQWPCVNASANTAPTAEPWSHLEPRPIPHLERHAFYPNRVVTMESVLCLQNRSEPGDASIETSQVGLPLAEDDSVVIQNIEALFDGSDGCEVQGLVPSRDDAWDGTRDPAVTLGFERELTAMIEIEVTAPQGVDIFIGSAERLIDGRFNNTIESRFNEKYTTREGRQVYRSLCWRAFRFLRLRFRHANERVQVHAVRAIRVRTPLGPAVDVAGDERLDAIDKLCRRTIRLCCVDGMFDTPWRESAQWLGDVALVTVPGLHWVYGDTELTGKFLLQAGLNGQPDGILSNLSNIDPIVGGGNIPDYSLWWLYGLREHRWYTGDDAWYHTLYPEAVRILRWFSRHLNENGLLENVPNWVFIDWANCEKRGMSSSLNAIFAVGCDVIAEAASVIGDVRTQQWASDMAATVRANYASTFIDPERGVVVDAVVDGDFAKQLSEHGMAAAIFAECLPTDVAATLIERAWAADEFADTWIEAQPFFTRVTLEALWQHGRTDLALRLIDQRWGKRFHDRGHDTCLEEWTNNGSYRNGPWWGFMRTTSHAWSACVSEFLRRRVTGIELLEPGCQRIRVRPYATEHPYTMTAMLPQGKLTVSHTTGSEPEISLPDGVENIV